jgi:hypothetical protein
MIEREQQSRPATAVVLLLSLALVRVLIHFLSNGSYGHFRDELYYIACSKHLAWGYVDHPPLSIAVLALTRALLGDSLSVIRLPALLAGAAALCLTGVMARELGGGRFAQATAALALLVAGSSLAITSFFSMNAFDLFFWVACALVATRILRTDDTARWPVFGALAGLALLNKISIVFLAFGIVVGLALTAKRKHLLSGRLWVGGGLALLIFLPHLGWQFTHDFATLEFMRNATKFKNAPMPVLDYIGAQILLTNPVAAPIWLAGLGYLLFARSARLYRPLGIAYLAILSLFAAQGAKAYYLAPAYPILMAAGGVAIESFTSRRRRWLRPALTAVVCAGGVLLGPLAIPLLSPEAYIRYATAVGLTPPREERNQLGELPQHLADRLGWENMVATIARVHQALPAADRARATVLTSNYGEAGAVDFFGPRHGLPPAISGHNNYWLWGPGRATGDVVIAVGVPEEDLRQSFITVERAATIVSPYAMPYETNLPVYVCRRLRRPVAEVWPQLKRFI